MGEIASPTKKKPRKRKSMCGLGSGLVQRKSCGEDSAPLGIEAFD